MASADDAVELSLGARGRSAPPSILFAFLPLLMAALTFLPLLTGGADAYPRLSQKGLSVCSTVVTAVLASFLVGNVITNVVFLGLLRTSYRNVLLLAGECRRLSKQVEELEQRG